MKVMLDDLSEEEIVVKKESTKAAAATSLNPDATVTEEVTVKCDETEHNTSLKPIAKKSSAADDAQKQ